MIPADWVEHRRSSDREVVGYIAFDGDDVVPMSLLGVPLSGPGEWHEAEALLDDTGLAQLAEPWWLRADGAPDQRVVIVEVDRERVVVVDAASALAVGAPSDERGRVELDVPTDRLRPA